MRKSRRELDRFRQALEKSRSEIQRIIDWVTSEPGSAEAAIFSAHLLFLEDPQFIERVEHAVRNGLVCVELAVTAAIDALAQILREADNEYLRDREEDLRDLGRRVLRHLAQVDPTRSSRIEPGSVLVARELLPSDLLEIDRRNVAGIVTEIGGETATTTGKPVSGCGESAADPRLACLLVGLGVREPVRV